MRFRAATVVLCGLLVVHALTADEGEQACASAGSTLRVGFFAYFEPVSYSADPDSGSTGFNVHRRPHRISPVAAGTCHGRGASGPTPGPDQRGPGGGAGRGLPTAVPATRSPPPAPRRVSTRRHLQSAGADQPQVVYLPDETALIEALAAGEIDAVARGEVGNLVAEHGAEGAFVVTALDSRVETGGFAVTTACGAGGLPRPAYRLVDRWRTHRLQGMARRPRDLPGANSPDGRMQNE